MNNLIGGAIIALIAIIPPVLVWRHSKRVDEAAAESGSFAQITTELNRIIKLTQDDNTEMRTRLDALDARLSEKDARLIKALADLADCVAEKVMLRAQITALEIRYGAKPEGTR